MASSNRSNLRKGDENEDVLASSEELLAQSFNDTANLNFKIDFYGSEY